MARIDVNIQVREISFREWIVHKVRKLHSTIELSAGYLKDPKSGAFRERAEGDRRTREMDRVYAGKEWRRLPERRMPEVERCSFDEFERWKKEAPRA